MLWHGAFLLLLLACTRLLLAGLIRPAEERPQAEQCRHISTSVQETVRMA
jgi:hypothetical protein